jgi:AraC-like DNA-binding protein
MTKRAPTGPASSVRIFFWHGRVLYVGPVDDLEVHAHHAVQAVVSPAGPFEIDIGDEPVRTRAVLIDSDLPHRLDSLGQDAAVFLLEPESLDAARLRRGCLRSCGHHLIGPELADPVIEALSVLGNRGAGCAEAAECFDRLLEAWGCGPGPLPDRDERIDAALAHIGSLHRKQISLSELAALVHLSESRFIHLFTEHVGIPPRRYLLWVRLMHAIEAAIGGGNLTAAAHDAGFADSAHLSRTFRRMFGRTPALFSSATKDSQFVQSLLCTNR